MHKLLLRRAKKEFSAFLLYKFLPNCPLDLVFLHFSDFPPKKGTERFVNPGVYGIHCFGTNRTYFRHGLNTFDDMLTDLAELKVCTFSQNLYEGPSLLLQDFLKYDLHSFIFIIFCSGLEWEDVKKRHQKIEYIKSFWTYEFYKLDEPEELE